MTRLLLRSFALVGIAASACSPFTASTETSGDGGTSPNGDASALPGTDGGSIDGGGTGGPFCAGRTEAFCDDFERTDPSNVQGPWSSVLAPENGATMTITGDFFASPAKSLRVTYPTKGSSGVSLLYEYPRTWTSMTLGFAMRLDDLPGEADSPDGTEATYIELVFASPQSSIIVLASKKYGLRIAEQTPTPALGFHSSEPTDAPIGELVRYELRVDLKEDSVELRSPRGRAKLELTLEHGTPMSFKLGNTFTSALPTARTAWFDDVLVDLK